MTASQTLLALALFAVPLSLNAQNRKQITAEGTEGFRALLKDKRLQPIGSIPELEEAIRIDPSRILIVAFRGADKQGVPRPDGLADLPLNLLRDLVEKGGGLFVATDQRTVGGWIADFDAAVDGGEIFAAGPARAYRDRSECPYVIAMPGAVPNLFLKDDRILQDVATNKPSSLKSSRVLQTLAVFPNPTWSRKRSGVPYLGNPAFAQGRLYPGGGHFLLLADHSVFINDMLFPPQLKGSNDNRFFAVNCINWMILGPNGGSRTYVMFIEDGKIWQKEDYNFAIQAGLSQRPEDLADLLWQNRDLLWENRDLAEGLVAQMEEDGVFSELEKSDPLGTLIRDLFDDWKIVRTVLILGTIVLLAYGLWSLIGSKSRFPKKVPRLALLLDRMRPRTGLLDLRLRSGLGSGQYYELARQRARETFAELDLQPAEDGPPPEFTVEGNWWQRSRTARELREVWAIAYGPEPVPVPAKQWAQWQARLNRLAVMIRGGAIRFG